MKINSAFEILLFLIGFVFGVGIFFTCFPPNSFKSNQQSLNYDTYSADKLFNKIKILCLVLTQPKDHQTKAMHVKNTWGKKCNKLIFLSSESDSKLGAIRFPYNESRNVLWGKVRKGMELAYREYYDDFDWYLKADDDSYFVMENLRHLLYQYNQQTAILIGHKFTFNVVKDGYTSGGGYVLSKKALQKLITKSIPSGNCRVIDRGAEDVELGMCLQNYSLILDAHNSKNEKEFFPFDLSFHLNEKIDAKTRYYTKLWFNVTQGNLNCCSDTFVNMHYVKPKQMYLLNYFIYNVYPFGLLNNNSIKLPRKLTFDEIVNASDTKSNSPNYVPHKVYHQFDDDEKF